MEIKLVSEADPISWAEIEKLAENSFGTMVKAVLDLDKKIMAINAPMHADEEAFLLENGSEQKSLWGINLLTTSKSIEYDSMINIRPNQNNRSRYVESEEIRSSIEKIVAGLIK